MADAVIMPKFGQTVEEVTIVRWHKREGDEVRKGDILFEVETEKAVLEAPSFYDGTLLRILVREGMSVPVSSVVAYIGKKGEKVPEAPQAPVVSAAVAPSSPHGREAPLRKLLPAEPSPLPAAPTPAASPPSRFLISPRARSLAKEKLIDPNAIRGTGPNGRVLERDVLSYLREKNYDRIRMSPAARALAAREGIDILTVKGTGEQGRILVADVERALQMRPRKMTRLRQVIARRMTESFTTTPHFYVTVSADLTPLLAYRRELKEQGLELSVTDFVLEATVLALVEFPVVNSTTDGETIRWRGSVELGLAVNTDRGLLVPVIRSAERLTLQELHAAAESLARKAREGQLTPDEMTGSSFTVSNMGMLDVENFMAIINPGEAAILAVSSARETPVVICSRVEVRMMMKMTLSADHRIVDGATAAAFLNSVKKKLEDLELWKRLTWL